MNKTGQEPAGIDRKRGCLNLGKWGRYVVLMPALLAMSGCAHVSGLSRHHADDKKTTEAAELASANSQNRNQLDLNQLDLEIATAHQLQQQLKLTHQLPPVVVVDPLLSGIQQSDIAQAKILAKRNFQRSWKTIEQRSRFVRSRLLDTLDSMKAPASLQVIPVVESTYNPYALSFTGAVGLWQLMPATARSLGIHTSHHKDGRRDIADSTTAAVHYLQRLHQRFDSWPLALAAYNIGPNALARRLRKQTWKNSDGLNRMPIPPATRVYVQSIIGLTALLEDHTFSFPAPVKTRKLVLQTPIDIHRLAQISGMPENDIFRFNPCLNQAQYLHKTVAIHVPESHYDTILSKLPQAGPRYVNTTVGRGESLWSIARNSHTTVAVLKKLNRGIGKYLHIGQILKLPANRLTRAHAGINPLLPTNRRIRYRVRSGDSLWRIASRFGTTPGAIARSNRISTKRMIRAGDTLWVYAKERPS